MNTIMNCSHSLLKLIDDILDLSKIEAGKLEFVNKHFELREVVRDAVDNYMPDAYRKGLELEFSIEDGISQFLIGDAGRVKQVLCNLIGNAVKFTDKGWVSVKVGKTGESTEKETLKFMVEDTGIGISDNERQYLFKTFSQVDTSTTRKYGGAGLGLAICKQLVEKMGGVIWVESEKSKGSKFIFTSEFEKAKEISEDIAVFPFGIPALGLRLLVVEDDESSRIVIRNMLEKMGNSVETAGNGREALEALEKNRFDAVLMDIQLPNMDGLQVTAMIRDREKASGRHTPIIAVTAHALKGDRERFLSSGMDEYIPKPIDMQALHKLLSGLCRHNDGLLSDSFTKYKLKREHYDKRQLDLIAGSGRAVMEEIADKTFKIGFWAGRRDFAKIEALAHEVKILALKAGADEIKNIAFKIEFAARRENIGDIVKLHKALADKEG